MRRATLRADECLAYHTQTYKTCGKYLTFFQVRLHATTGVWTAAWTNNATSCVYVRLYAWYMFQVYMKAFVRSAFSAEEEFDYSRKILVGTSCLMCDMGSILASGLVLCWYTHIPYQYVGLFYFLPRWRLVDTCAKLHSNIGPSWFIRLHVGGFKYIIP